MAVYSTGRGKGEGVLRDFAHAAKIFTSSPGYIMTPRAGFLFHVRLVYNTTSQSASGDASSTLSVLTKSIDLPKFTIDTTVLNKYNRKEVFQQKMVYEPVTMVMHDDGDNNVRDFWLAYSQWYYADSNVSQQAYAQNDTYAPTRLATKYGLDNGSSGSFLKQVEIYSMHNHVYTKYVLINPMIADFQLDNYDYSAGNKVMQATVRFQYENVVYAEGSTEDIAGFGQNSYYYDNTYSQLSPSDLMYSGTGDLTDLTEVQLVSKFAESVITNFEVNDTPTIKLTTTQAAQIAVNAATSLSSKSRFSFPSATEVSNQSSLALVNAGTQISQGVISQSSAVSSNGQVVGTSSITSIGSVNASSSVQGSLLINPKVPSNLTATEAALFAQTYPPLPSTDSRTRGAPYV